MANSEVVEAPTTCGKGTSGVSCWLRDAAVATAVLTGEEEMVARGGFAMEDGGTPVSSTAASVIAR
jgi:hypothetical protein